MKRGRFEGAGEMTLILGDPVLPGLVHSLPGLSQTPTLQSPGDHEEVGRSNISAQGVLGQ